ncbi:GcrA family cell cycle regulator [Neomegalonema sp.]|uniref:GcrA family cell cycle regulator n=1 Tax=Neomegalonema sp. TaxID=2039713 RepID=UPI002611420E|nr:GcrA family cell cycle regulator [Neomegalonema sp.]MDD2870033.1 GcrA family cell cycle regulator [Neomegalonema sp.]
MSWTDERVEQLKALWHEGASASQIAKQLGGVSRNAVIGKVHRLGLSNRVEKGEGLAEPEAAEAAGVVPPAEAAPAPEAARAADPVEPEEEIEELEDEDEEIEEVAAPQVDLASLEKKARRLSLLELTERTCKWPIGDPNHDDFHFCGLPSAAGKPYCAAHTLAAYQPMSNRRDRNRPPKLLTVS